MISYIRITEMLKFLTQKLKNQSLAEVCPLLVTENWKHSPQNLQKSPTTVITQVDAENCDKAQYAVPEEESDEENAEICSITKGLDPAEKPSVYTCTEHEDAFHSTTTVSTCSPGVSRMPFRQIMNVNHEDRDSNKSQDITTKHQNMESGCTSTKNNISKLNTNLQQPDLLQGDDNSSEEELASINFHEHSIPEKRKWSQMSSSNNPTQLSNVHGNICHSVGGCDENIDNPVACDENIDNLTTCNENIDSPGNCDEEVCELVSQPPKPSKFSCSPPRGVPRLRRTVSPKIFLANVTPVSCESCSCWISPRKRQRQSLTEVSPIVFQRPCLDLEKMQKTNLKKHASHSGSKAKLVKIKTFNAMGKTARCMVDPELFTFRSISTYNQLTPVEEPCAL